MSSLAGLFQRGGHPYRTIPDLIALLPRGSQFAADVAMKCVLRLKARGKLDESATDLELARESQRMAVELAAQHGVDLDGIRGWSPSLIQKGLHALHVTLGKLGVPLIGRRSGIGMAGRRQITIEPLAGREPPPGAPAPAAAAAAPPPAPPPVDSADTMTDRAGSSSSLAPPTGTGPEPTDGTELTPELLAAVDLVPGLSRERLTGWARTAGAELAARAVAWLRIWLCHPDPTKRPESPRWAESALERWREQLDAATLTMEDIDATIAAKVRKWGHRDPAAQAKAEAEKKAKATAAAREEAAEKAREQRLRGLWAALSEGERQEIRAKVRAENPAIGRWGNMLEPLCLAELERRTAAEEPRAP